MSTTDPSTEPLVSRLTAFPRIESPYCICTVPDSAGASKESLIRSWAVLLRGYQAGDIVNFMVDGQVVSVDFNDGRMDVSPLDIQLINREGSAIYYNSVPPLFSLPSIYAYLDHTAKQIIIAASQLVVPSTHVSTLCSQLSSILHSKPTSRTFGNQPANSSIYDASLSILNHPPQFLPGPKLLHDLLLHSSIIGSGVNSRQALDYLPLRGDVRQTLTYPELEMLSTRFAQKLCFGPGENNIVPILVSQSPKLYIALLGILKAGGAFVPLQLDTPVDRIKFVVSDVCAQIVVADQSLQGKLCWDGGPRVVFIGEVDADVNSVTDLVLDINSTVPINPTSPAYVMYTSGSTGAPKGITISHSAVTQSLLAHEKHIPGYSRFLQFASPSFDVFVFEVFFTFFRGATLVGCERSRLLSNVVDVINCMDVDALELTPTVLGELVVSKDRIPGVKFVLTIGEMLTQHIIKEFGDGQLHGMYGPTEAAIHCTIAPNFPKGAVVGDIGIPLDTVSAFILGPAIPGQEVNVLPVGWVGELAIGGPQLADGYLNRPEQTAEAYINTGYGRLYRTGDRARMHPRGTIELIGRISSAQVKLRGQRIELGEIEEAIRKIFGVKGVVVSLLSGKLIAFVACDKRLTEAALRDEAKKWLPGYMVPSIVITMAEIPKLASGKADKKLLESEFMERRTTQNTLDHVEVTMDDLERTIAHAAMELVEGVIISKSSSFIANGLDSLLAIRLCSKLRAAGLVVQVVDILQADCVQELARHITSISNPILVPADNVDITKVFEGAREAGYAKLAEANCVLEDIEDIIPCTTLQEMMLTETVRDPTVYSNWILLEVPVEFSTTVIEAAFRKLVQRNEILRTGFLHLGQASALFLQVIWDSSRSEQFQMTTGPEKGLCFEISDMLSPPFRGYLFREANNLKLSIHIHHAVYDGWSWDNILKDFNKILAKTSIPNRPQFREVVSYCLKLSTSNLDSSIAFWEKVLVASPSTKLPNFYGYSGVKPEILTKQIQLRVPRQELVLLARKLGVSPQVIIQTAWAYLLGVYLHSSDITFGTVVSGRTIPLPGIEEVIGPCISTLPMRVKLGDKSRNCVDLMRDVHDFNRMILMYSGLDLRQIRKLCGVGYGEFDTLLVWQQSTPEEEIIDAPQIRQVDGIDHLEYLLLLEAEPFKKAITLKATYNIKILPPAQLAILLSQLDSLVSRIVADPFTSINSLSFGLEESLLSMLNPCPLIPSLEDAPSLAVLVEKTTVKFPDAVALQFAHTFGNNGLYDKKLTYRQLNTAANALAHKLLAMGAAVDELICLFMDKSPMLYISILAIVKAGAGYLPLSPDTSIDKLHNIVNEASVRICLSTSDIGDRLSMENLEILKVDKFGFESYPSNNPTVRNGISGLAYAVFTSEGTGVPKGVLVTHKNIITNIKALQEVYPYKATSKILQFCSQAFDVSIFEIFFAWTTGLCLCTGTKDTLLRDLEGIINAFEVTHLSLTPTVADLIDPAKVPTVELLVTAGEAVTQRLLKNWAGRGLYQGYGRSETTNICTINPAMRKEHHANNIGTILPNTSVFILAQHDGFELIPRGGVGELCFGGSQVGRGYLNMPDITSKKFISHPRYGGLYRSGDLGRLLPDGHIEFVGREDDQMKTRGHRIELREINYVLLQQGMISDAITLTIVTSKASVHIVSFIVPQQFMNIAGSFEVIQASSVITKVIREAFRAVSNTLATYMIPTNIVPITKLPITSQGKIDKGALQRCYLGIDLKTLVSFGIDFRKKEDGSESWTSLERALATAIAQLANVPVQSIERNTSIFHLGLDSISAIHLSRKVGEMGYQQPEISQIMQHQTLASLAEFIGEQGNMEEIYSEPPISRLQRFSDTVRAHVLHELELTESDILAILPCTPLQEAMLTERVGSNTVSYYNYTVFELGADILRLKGAWDIAMKRNDIFRTCFCVVPHPHHAYAQVVLQEYSIPWTEIAVQTDEDVMSTVHQTIGELTLAMGIDKPPLAFKLFKTPIRSLLMMLIHHSLYDGFAMDLLLEEVRMAYYGLKLPSRNSFSSVLNFIENCDMLKADIFWKNSMDGFKPVQFPDLTGKSISHRGDLTGMATRSMQCSGTLRDIESGCKHLSTSLLALGQSAWARLLAAFTGESDICFGNVVSGRTIPVPGIEEIIAPCFNTIPLRVQLTPGINVSTLVTSLQQANAEALDFQHTPLRRIMKVLQTEGQVLFDTLFILQYARESSLEAIWTVVEDGGEMDFAVVVELIPRREMNTLELILHFRRDVMNDDTANIILRQLDQSLNASLHSPDIDINDYRFMQKSLLSISNSPPEALPETTDSLLHSEFEKRAEDNPTGVALEFLEDTNTISQFTYRVFNEAANRIAHQLLEYGVKRDEAIPICLEKCPQFYTCILAVLKAGCAFTPIDPSTPPQRILFMLKELSARFAITDSACEKALSGVNGINLVILDRLDLSSLPVVNPLVSGLSSANLAYRLYTSGSTGLPKAVSVEIKSVLQTIRATRIIIPWTSESRLLQSASTTFDMCYFDCFIAWNYGFALCSAGKRQLLDDLEGTIKRMDITILFLTPAVASTLCVESLPQIDFLSCIGEVMTQSLVSDWEGRCVNSYGPTEAAMLCTMFPVNSTAKPCNIGSPFPTSSFHVFPSASTFVLPILGCGELCIGGPQLAREYHNNPKLTKERFITVGSERLYRTGDTVRMLTDGTFEFIGRSDDQVKIRGLRVELDEINHVIKNSHQDIKEAMTMVLQHFADAKEQLVSFLSLESRKHKDASPTVIEGTQQREELLSAARATTQRALPTFMIPGVIIVVDHIPLSPAGKVNKGALKALFTHLSISSFTEISTPEADGEWSKVELEIRHTLAEVSQLAPERITKMSTIYQIGLDSISAAQVAMKLRKRGLLVSVIDILECPSIKQLSPRLCYVNSPTEDEVSSSLSPLLTSFASRFTKLLLSEYRLLSDEIIAVYPCTPVQEGMLSRFLNSGTGLYFNHYLYRLSSTVDISQLRNSWKIAMDNNDILRAGFFDIGDNEYSFATAIYSRVGIELPWTVRYTNDNDLHATIEKRKSELTSQVLECLTIPPWYLTLFITEGSTQLLLSAHHALYDVQSLKMILDTVLDSYLRNYPSNRPHFSGPLGRIVQSSVDETSLALSRSFWLKQLEGYSISRFPCLTPTRVQDKGFHAVTQHSLWPLSQIETSCQNLGFSLHAVTQAAWARVLSAYTGETQVTYGLVLSGRTGIPGAENVVFPCLTTIPSVVFVSESNHELVSGIQDNNIRILQHQHTPLRLIQNWLGTPNQSLFDSIFVYQKTLSNVIRKSPFWVTIEESGNVDYNVSIEVEPTQNNHLVLRATCRDYVLPQEQTVILLQQLDAALIDILCNSSGKCTDFSHFPPQLLAVLPPSTREIPSDVKLLHHFVERNCDRIPNKVALEFATGISESKVEKKQWTYKDLDMESNKIANFLRYKGLTTGGLVGICFDKSAEASFAIIGILKAGCGFVALDPTAPIDRKLFILKDSQTQCVLTMDRFVHDLRPIVPVEVYAVGEDVDIERSSTERPDVADLAPGSLCYCLYTSGTTGTPKGCMITHENAVQAMLAFQRIFKGHWDEESKFLQFASFHFDVSVLEQFWSWSVGICVTSTPRDILFEDLALAIRKLEVTHLDLTPSLAALLIPEEVPSLLRGVFIVGGEALKQDILDTWGELGVLYNGYGPTEVTIGCTMLPRVPQDGRPSNIGLPFENVGSFVMVPSTDRPTLRGAIGEFCVSGKLVGTGYLNRQDLTRDKFPYMEKYGERIYRTGDLVRVLHNGCFDFLGRADDQIKLRGQRLEIGEINAILKRAHSTVNTVTTLVLKHPKQQKDQLVSFISLDGTAIVTGSSILTGQHSGLISTLLVECKKKLPVYMVPTYIIPLSCIPLSVNNKVDNKGLAKIYMETSLDILQSLASKEEREDSLSRTETQIQSVLANMTKLHLKDIKSSSTIFELGLDSVSVVSLARRLKQCGFHTANVSIIMQNYTLEALAQALSTDKKDYSSFSNDLEGVRLRLSAFAAKNAFEICEQLGRDEEKVQQIFPCSALQEGMILRFINSDDAPYFVAFTLELNIGIDLEALKNAWDAVRKSTDILRTCFCDTPDGYAQVILKDNNIDWATIGIIRDQDIQETVENERLQIAQLNKKLRQPPIHFRVIYTPSRTVLLLTIFHALYDGISMPLILGDVEKAYHNQYYRRPSQFSHVLPHILSCNLEEADNFWKQKLGSNQFSPFPRLSTGKQGDITVKRSIKASELMIEEGCKIYGCTAQSLFQATWASVLAPYVGNNVTFGVVISGRTLPLDYIEDTIGPIFNTIPCLFQLEEPHTWRDLVRQAHEFNAESIPYHHTPLRLIRKWLSVPPGREVINSLFVYRKVTKIVTTTTFPLWELLDSSTSVDFPLSLDIEHHSDGILTITVAAKGDILSEEGSLELIDNVESAFTRLLQNPESSSRITDISIVKHAPEAVTPRLDNLDSGFEWTPVAITIRRTVATLTGLDESEIPSTASLFELGLDSVEAIKLSARLRRDEIQASFSTIMRNPTIRGLSLYLKETSMQPQKASDNSGLLDFEVYARKRFPKELFEAIYPTTPLQEAMVAETLVSDYLYYFNHDVLELDQGIDLERLHNAWKTVIQYNPILRTSFFHVHELGITSPHAFGQVVHRQSEVQWMRISLTAEDDLWVKLQEAMEESAKAANLMERPPLLLTVLTVKESHYLLLSMSHALYDGWSLGLLHTDIYRAYHNSLTPRPSPLPLLEIILKNNLEESSRFWRQLLQGAEASVFPTLSPNVEESISHRKEFLSRVDYAAVISFCKRLGITLQTLGQTCWGLILAHYSRRPDLLFGTVLSGRDTANAEEIMFPAMNTVPVRVILHGTYRTMLEYMQDNTGNVLRYQYAPLRTIQRLVRKDGIRIFDTLFICQRAQPDCQLRKLYRSIRGSSDIEYKVCVEIEPTGSSLIWRIACKSSVMALSQVENMLQMLDSLLGHMIEHPDFPAISYQKDTIRFGNTCPVQIQKYSSESTEPVDQSFSESGKASWCPIGLRVRRVLATIANLPEREIKHHQTIFHLGLDSISAIRVSSEFRKEGIFLGVTEILRQATIGKIALAAAKEVTEGTSVPGIAIDVDAILNCVLGGIDVEKLLCEREIEVESLARVLPATPGQVYMLSAWQNSRGKLFMPTFRFRSHLLDSTRLQVAWERLTEEEPILRTTFISTGDENNPIIQLVFTNCKAQFSFQQGPLNTNSQLGYILLEASYEQCKAISLTDPPVRIKLVNMATESVILLTIHHALYDGVSLPLLLNKLRTIYNSVPQLPSAEPPRLNRIQYLPSATFADVVAYGVSRDRSKQEDFWCKYLDGVASTLFFSHHAPNEPVSLEERISIFNPTLFSDRLKLESHCRNHGITIQSLFLASFSKIYAETLFSGRHTEHWPTVEPKSTLHSPNLSRAVCLSPGQDQDIIFGVYLSNRHLPIYSGTGNLNELAAPTLNLLPLRVRHPKSTSLHTLARTIQKDLGEISHGENSAGVSMADIERWTRKGQAVGVEVDVWFNYLRLPGINSAGRYEITDHQQDGESFNDGVDAWTKLEEIKAVIPATAAEAQKHGSEMPTPNQGGPLNLEQIGGNMLATNVVRTNFRSNLDIEVSVAGRNIGFGIFAREGLIDYRQAEDMLEGIKEVIDGAY